MKKWVTIPMSLIAAILPGCGRESENDEKIEQNKPVSEKIEEKEVLSLISKEKDPSDCGFSISREQ